MVFQLRSGQQRNALLTRSGKPSIWDRLAITHLKLFLPPAAVDVIAHRSAYLDPRAVNVEIYEWRPGQASATPVDLKDYGNVQTHLAARRQAELLKEAHTGLVPRDLWGRRHRKRGGGFSRPGGKGQGAETEGEREGNLRGMPAHM